MHQTMIHLFLHYKLLFLNVELSFLDLLNVYGMYNKIININLIFF